MFAAGSMRLPSFIPIPRDRSVSSPDRKKSRTGDRGRQRQQQQNSSATTSAEPEILVSTHEQQPFSLARDTGATLSPEDPVQWNRRFLLDLLATNTLFDWDADFLPRLNDPAVAEPQRCPTPSEHLYETTILGALAAYNHRTVPKHVIQAALDLCPKQAQCSQYKLGCTPLHSAVWNTMHVIDASIIAMMVKVFPEGVHLPDEDGLTPLDHCLYEMVLGAHQQRISRMYITATTATERLEALLLHAPPDQSLRSPLIHLLSLVTNDSAGSSGDSMTQQLVLVIVRLLLEWDPSLLTRVSPDTGCTPLHVAIRNCWFDEDLIRILSSSEKEGGALLFTAQNMFGDTVLHVVCATGAPDPVLRYVLQRTVMAVGDRDSSISSWSPHPVVWSANHAGYTPVDLEWIRRVECGDKSRPLDARGVPATVGKQYTRLLERLCRKLPRGSQCRRRMEWIVEAALPSWSHVSALLSPHGPTLPRPVVDLLSNGAEASLHDVLPVRIPVAPTIGDESVVWETYTRRLITPISCQERDDSHSLPLHVALRLPSTNRSVFAASSSTETPIRDRVVQRLIQAWPGAAMVPDPSLCLYPFQVAATNPMISLETVYLLLRCNPGALQ